MDATGFLHTAPTETKPAAETEAWRVLAGQIADYIDKHGHCQNGTPRDGDGRVCVAEAAYLIARGECRSLLTDLEAALELAPSPAPSPRLTTRPIAVWSDTTPTATVLAELRRVARS